MQEQRAAERACGAENLRLEKECFGVLEYLLRAARKLVEKLTVELCRRFFGRHRLRLTMSHARGALPARWMPYRRASPGKPTSWLGLPRRARAAAGTLANDFARDPSASPWCVLFGRWPPAAANDGSGGGSI